MVKNPNPVAEWKVEGRKYKKMSTKDLLINTPAFNETGLVTCCEDIFTMHVKA
jgi:hypothetical protein